MSAYRAILRPMRASSFTATAAVTIAILSAASVRAQTEAAPAPEGSSDLEPAVEPESPVPVFAGPVTDADDPVPGPQPSAGDDAPAGRVESPKTDSTVEPPAAAQAPSEPPASPAEEAAMMSMFQDIDVSDTSLDIYGFGDFGYFGYYFGEDNPWREVIWQRDQFMLGNLNVYLRGKLGAAWTSLMEVRFLYLPNGHAQTDSSGEQVFTDTSVMDPTELQRELKWGGIEIERAWVEWAPYWFLAVRGGLWLTPYGVWNREHGSPTTINIGRPYLTGEQLFPERQTGVQVAGSFSFGPHEVGYHLTASNGRGPASEYVDFDRDIGVGGRLWARLDLAGDLTVGVSGYDGRYTEKLRRFGLGVNDDGDPMVTSVDRVVLAYDERAFGADLSYSNGGLTVVTEVAVNDRAYTKKGRPFIEGFARQSAGLAPDQREWGAYGLVGYRFEWNGVMPYVMAEGFSFGEANPFASLAGLKKAVGYTLGMNVRPLPRVVLKAELQRVDFPDAVVGSPAREAGITIMRLQTAWAF